MRIRWLGQDDLDWWSNIVALKGRSNTAQGEALGTGNTLPTACKGALSCEGSPSESVGHPFRAYRDGVKEPRASPWAELVGPFRAVSSRRNRDSGTVGAYVPKRGSSAIHPYARHHRTGIA
jgi:hypothetical protein